jgi:hypothetical protein
MLSVPSVTMNGGRLIRVTKNPFKAPPAVPIRMPIRIASGPGTPPEDARLAMISIENTVSAPTDRSMPAVRMISVWPMASAAMIATCWNRIDNVCGCRNRGLTTAKTITATISTSNGLRAGWACRTCWMRCVGD